MCWLACIVSIWTIHPIRVAGILPRSTASVASKLFGPKTSLASSSPTLSTIHKRNCNQHSSQFNCLGMSFVSSNLSYCRLTEKWWRTAKGPQKVDDRRQLPNRIIQLLKSAYIHIQFTLLEHGLVGFSIETFLDDVSIVSGSTSQLRSFMQVDE